MKKIITILIVFLIVSCKSSNTSNTTNKVLVFTKTSGFRHTSIETGVETIKELGKTNSDAELILHDVFGAIQYKGPGVFLAAGSGITPFIAIFRDLHKKKQLKGNRLIYSNKTVEDIILGPELLLMLKTNFVNVITRQNTIGFVGHRIDRRFLIGQIADFNQHFYVCGPESFVKSITRDLLELGVTPNSLVIEE